MTKVREIIMAAMGMLPIAANASSPAPVADGNETQRRPHIIFIMCDDMGYGDLGCYGQQRIETPNLDRMAQEGMRFTQAYAGSPVSAPSRASFMTGQHAGHTHVRGNREYWNKVGKTSNLFGNNSDYSIIGQEPYLMTHKIIPEVMKEAGYTTGMFGKWAGGYYNMQYPDTYVVDANGNSDTSKFQQSSSASLPNKRGVDCYYGYICQFQAHTYYPNFLNRYDPEKYGDKHVVVDVLEQNIQHKDVASGDKDYENREQYTSDLIHQYALDWIDRQDGTKPFLGIFTYTLPHAEWWQPQDSLVQKYTEKFKGQDSEYGGNFGSWYYRNYGRRAQFAAMVSRLDAQVGEIFDKLKEKGLDENTLVIFTSDNGPHEEGGADPAWFNHDGLLRGTKRSTHEGGIRVPFIVKGPGVPAGEVNDHQLAFYDVMPTLLDYAGLDGSQYSMKSSTAERCYDGISFKETMTGNDAAQEKHEFLYWEFHETNMMALRMGDWKMVVNKGTPYLYDLTKDLHEDTDVAAQHPEVVKQMIEIIHQEHTESSMFNVTLPEIPEDDGSIVVTSINGSKLYTMECQPNDGHTTRFISDNAGTLNGQSSEGSKFSFEKASNGGYYIKSEVSGKYINANDGQTDISFDSTPKTAWTLGQLNSNDTYVYFTIGDTKKYLNNHQGGADNLRVASHVNPVISTTNKCSLWTLHQYDDPVAKSGLASGFYRFKHVSSSKYLAAPAELPKENTSDNTKFKATFIDNIDESDAHRDVWYIENLGTNDTKEANKDKVIYKVWCFQGGYGLATNPQPSVYGSYTNQYCPRLYSIVKTDAGYYTLAGHPYDNTDVKDSKNLFGLISGSGAIGDHDPLAPTNENYATLSRTGSASAATSWWRILPVAPISKSVTIGSIGVGTFAFNSDVQIPEGVEAYVATERGDRIRLNQLEGETIPARMGVVLRKTDEIKNDFQFEAVHGLGIGMSAVKTEGGSPTPVDDKGNLLVGTLAETSLAVGDYILTRKKVNDEATDEVVFGKISKASNIAANKAYLPAEAVSQTRGFYTLMWDDVETGIEEIQGAVQKDGIFVEGQQIVIVKNGLKYNAKGQRVK